MSPRTDVTALLLAWNQGDRSALDRLVPLVYADLRRIARGRLRREARRSTISATGLVHETYMRLVDQRAVRWESRGQFFAVASELMRRILVDHARRRGAAKRGGGGLRLALEEDVAEAAARDLDLIALDTALQELASLDARSARVVELRFFGGLSHDEAALALGVSRATVERDWTTARAWLFERLAPRAPGGGP
jgi:RNA polymerase sigma factor (TIGR02999 family)